MRFTAAIDLFLDDLASQGRVNSPHTEAAYRAKLEAHAEDIGNRDPSKTGRDDVKATLRRWRHPNSQRQAHAILTSFYRWCMEEGIRDTNPAEQVRRAKRREPQTFRPTRTEVVRLLDAADALGRRERWVTYIGVCAGLRSQEIRGLQGRHFTRDGWLWVSGDIAKLNKERWVAVLPELVAVVDEIRTLVGHDDYVIPSRRTVDPAHNTIQVDLAAKPISATGLYKMVGRVGKAAGMPTRVTPHTLRHAYGQHMVTHAGVRATQALMGHASIETTADVYTNAPTLDELAVSVSGFSYRPLSTHEQPTNPDVSVDAR